MKMIKNKKGFTLIELIVTIAVLGVLVLLASPRFFGHTQNAELTKGFANAKSIEKASELYYMDHEDWPRLTDEPYTSEEIESYSERIFDRTGQEVNLDTEGNYYDIDYDKLSDYIQVPDDKKNYILQNPVGKIYYMENLSAEGEKRVDYENKMQANIETPNKPAVNNITDNSAVIDGGSGTEVRIGEGAWHDSPHTFTNLNEDSNYVAYSRYKKTDTHYASNVSEGFNFRTDTSSLYEFTATFTNAGSTGRTGPSQSQLDNAYAGTALEGIVSSQNGIQLWTVPKSGKYRIETYGAQGGSGYLGSVGGSGALMKGNFDLTEGTLLNIVIGQKGIKNANNKDSSYGGGGGGGTFIWMATKNTPLIIAGGGGGGLDRNSISRDKSIVGSNATVQLNGTSSSTGELGGIGGHGGGGGNAYAGGGGAGWLSNGHNDSNNQNFGGIRSTFLGGQSVYRSGTNYGVDGGFGGGGASMHGGGGGGGYSGGGGGNNSSGNGGGGGSFNSGANQENSVGNTGHGKVIITYIGK